MYGKRKIFLGKGRYVWVNVSGKKNIFPGKGKHMGKLKICLGQGNMFPGKGK